MFSTVLVPASAHAPVLARLASQPASGRGRRHPEAAAPPRNDYQRDRDRIVHSSAFRRLVYKTQVFLNHEGDLFRTRMTHSLEVAQLARSMARALGLHEDLVEAVALAHDLGHTPFGHAGQDALNICMAEHGGFEHNLQSLRVVDRLEQRYPDYDGLNLSFESREGILKHCSLVNARLLEAEQPDGVARRFIDHTQPSLEAQLCNLADEIAYNAHDVDDGVRSGLITFEQLDELSFLRQLSRSALSEHPHLQGKRLLYDVIRRMISLQVADVLRATQDAVNAAQPSCAWSARRCGPLVCFSAEMRQSAAELKHFLMRNLYRHPQVMQTTGQARQVVHDLFKHFSSEPTEMAEAYAHRSDVQRAAADYIAGMTDRFALREHARLTGQQLLS